MEDKRIEEVNKEKENKIMEDTQYKIDKLNYIDRLNTCAFSTDKCKLMLTSLMNKKIFNFLKEETEFYIEELNNILKKEGFDHTTPLYMDMMIMYSEMISEMYKKYKRAEYDYYNYEEEE